MLAPMPPMPQRPSSMPLISGATPTEDRCLEEKSDGSIRAILSTEGDKASFVWCLGCWMVLVCLWQMQGKCPKHERYWADAKWPQNLLPLQRSTSAELSQQKSQASTEMSKEVPALSRDAESQSALFAAHLPAAPAKGWLLDQGSDYVQSQTLQKNVAYCARLAYESECVWVGKQVGKQHKDHQAQW